MRRLSLSRRAGRGRTLRRMAESQEGQPFYTNDKKKEQSIEGYLEFYTQEEFDTICDDIQAILYKACDAWQLDFVEYLDQEKILRFTWHWKIRG